MNRQTRSQVLFAAWCLMAAVAVVCALTLVAWLPTAPGPVDRAPSPFVSTAGPTTRPGPRLNVPITALIVQQNPRCWSGVPGQVCP
jgi:hypothetical protein